MIAQRVQRADETDEVAGNELCTLMDELIERVLAIGARFAPINRSRLIVHVRPLQSYVLAITFHGQLLKVRREALQILVVRQNGNSLRLEEVVVPDGKQSHQHR